MITKFKIGIFATLLFAGILTLFFHKELILQPNKWLINPGGDSIKNYFTYLYHINNDSTYSHFEGMNYPFGEQVVFTDNQPLLSNSIKWWGQFFPEIKNNALGIKHLSLMASIVFCALLLFLLLSELGVGTWFAVAAALGITFLSPQLWRLGGHFALAYVMYIPLIFYLLWHYEQKSNLIHAILLSAAISIFSGLHLYYLAIGVIFIAAYLFVSMLRKGFLDTLRRKWHLLPAIILPYLIISIWLYFTDTATFRPSSTYGYLLYKACWESVFLPINFPLGDWITAHLIKIRSVEFEGIAYIGFVAFCFSLFLLGNFFYSLFNRKSSLFHKVANTTSADSNLSNYFLQNLLISACLLLLFTFELPFILGLQSTIDYIGPLRQFRSIGRFAWVFYYAINIVCFYFLYRYGWKSRNKFLKIIPVLSLVVLFTEAYQFNVPQKYNLHEIDGFSKNTQVEKWIQDLDVENYQAILPLPYYHVGSENFWLYPDTYPVPYFLLSYHKNLPLMSVMMSRTSMLQTTQQLQMTHEVISPPPAAIAQNLLAKDILLYIDKKIELTPAENSMANAATIVFEDENRRLAALPVNYWKNECQKKLKSWLAEFDTTRYFKDKYNYFTYRKSENYLAHSDLNKQSKGIFQNEKIHAAHTKPEAVVLDDFLPEALDSAGWYKFSVWLYVAQDEIPRLYFRYQNWDENGSAPTLNYEEDAIRNKFQVFQDGWALFETVVEVPAGKKRLRFSFFGKEKPKELRYAAPILFPNDTDLYRKDDAYFCKNNRCILMKNAE
ncbi:MAG: hypothetical protein H6554_02405 [Chitinophagales bacterium]|nr:hypothetical protein [Chitinophagales bacterium]